MNVASVRATTPTKSTPVVNTYDGADAETPRRSGSDRPTGDEVLDATHDNVGISLDFYQQVLGRNSYDGKGSDVNLFVHDEDWWGNASWGGGEIRSGAPDGDVLSKAPGTALDVIAHELAHGLIEHTANLDYDRQPGALNESFADVLGEATEQWHENRGQFGTKAGVQAADWKIAEDVINPDFAPALRDMRKPGKVSDDYVQPRHMDDYVTTDEDAGGVHINSGIPNHAAWVAAQEIGTEKLAKVWYHALTEHLPRNASFSEAAAATVSSAAQLYGEPVTSAVRDAWAAVGVL
ncbi:MAG: peptidase [Thermoleophilia bacterium]|nr:peptidase [Thermoleophilia bacterium]